MPSPPRPVAASSEPMSVAAQPSPPLFGQYDLDRAFDEMFEAPAHARPHYQALVDELAAVSLDDMRRRQVEADRAFLTQGITFTIYGDAQGTERIFPFDLLPRIVTAREWDTLERGLAQRLVAINLFLKDIYNEGRILAEGVVPRELVFSCRHYRREMRGVRVHRDVYVSVAGTDLVRLEDGRFVVLEDNLRVMRYTVRHVTRFTYETPITESVMEARMQPRSDGFQRCVHFSLTTTPQARVMTYPDHDGNAVHHFDIPARHSRLVLTAEALIDTIERQPSPEMLGPEAWTDIDALAESGEWFEHLAPSAFAMPTPALVEFARELHVTRTEDPLRLLRRLMRDINTRLEYRPKSTRVDSPIDEALTARCGVCQDFAHIFIALARQLGVPSRYVSGYLFPRTESENRTAAQATHAWAECYLPGLGWSGFDPTNNEDAGEGHIRVAVGRDYADVPPTRGVFKGATAVKTELAVAVRVASVKPPVSGDVLPFTPWMSRDAGAPLSDPADSERQQQQ